MSGVKKAVKKGTQVLVKDQIKAVKNVAKGNIKEALAGSIEHTGPLGEKLANVIDKPKGLAKNPAPVEIDPAIAEAEAAKEEELKRKRRGNIITKPLGQLVQQALISRTLTGQ